MKDPASVFGNDRVDDIPAGFQVFQGQFFMLVHQLAETHNIGSKDGGQFSGGACHVLNSVF